MELLLQLLILLLGASLGSFAFVVILRLPQGISWIYVRSFCPGCNKAIKPWHNVPILSYLSLRGRCAYCGYVIPLRGFFLEVITGCFALIIYSQSGLSLLSLIKVFFFLLMVVILYIDLDHFFIPINMLFCLWILGGLYVWHGSMVGNIVASGASFVFLATVNVLTTYLFRKRGRLHSHEWAMGWGDPFLLGGIALFIEPLYLSWLLVLASSLGIIYGLSTKFLNVVKASSEVPHLALPFGTFMCLSGIFFFIF